MPQDAYFGGHGNQVMNAMTEQYGPKKGKRVFYATANKQKANKKVRRGKARGSMLKGDE